MNARSIQSSTLWDWLGHHGRTVVVINVPMTYPPRPVNGALICGLLTPRGAPTFTYPPELSGELRDYVIDLDHLMDTPPFAAPPGHRVDLPLSPLLEQLADMLDKRARTSLTLMSSYAWDLFWWCSSAPTGWGTTCGRITVRLMRTTRQRFRRCAAGFTIITFGWTR